MLIRGIVGERRTGTELLKTIPAVWAALVRINQATDTDQVARLELCDRRADLGDPADDFMTGNAGVDRGHDTVPFVPDSMKVGMADTAEEDFNLNVAIRCFTARDGGGCQRRSGAGCRVSFGVVHGISP